MKVRLIVILFVFFSIYNLLFSQESTFQALIDSTKEYNKRSGGNLLCQAQQGKKGKDMILPEQKSSAEIDYLQYLNNKALQFYRDGILDSAIYYGEILLKLCRLKYNTDHPGLAAIINNMATYYNDRGNYKDAEPLYKEALEMTRRIFKTDHPDLARSINNLAYFYNIRGNYKDAEPLYKEALEMYRRIFKGDNPNLAQSINNMAMFFDGRGDYKLAEPLFKESLEMRRRIFKGDNPDLAQSINNMAYFYNSRGDYKQADPLYKEALGIYRRIFKGDHPDLANSISNMAMFYDGTGEYEQAESLFKEALDMRRRIFKGDHPDLAKNINNIATFYYDRGNYKDAETFYIEAFEMRRRIFKTDHPDLANSINNMAAFYNDRGNFKDAETLYKEALEMNRRIFKTDHPDLARSINNMAYFYNDRGRYVDAEPLYKESLEMRRRIFKTDHPDLANSINNMAYFYKCRGDYKLAEPLYKEALGMYRSIFKDDHPDLAKSMNNMAIFYDCSGDYKLVEPLLKETLVMYRHIFKSDHPDLATSINNIAYFYNKIGNYKDAELLYKEALEMRRRIFKTDHPDLASSINNLANFNDGRGNFKDAEPLYKEALEMRRRIFKTDHPDLAGSINNMGSFYHDRGNYKDAESLYKEALEMFRRIFKTDHPYLAGSINNLATFYKETGRNDDAESLFIEALQINDKMLRNYFPSLSEIEKEQFWQTLDFHYVIFNSFAIERTPSNPLILSEMYNNQLFTKALLLNATKKVRERILNSNNNELIDKYMKWIDEKEYLAKLYSLTKTEIDSKGINADSLERAANELEKVLSLKSELFAKEYEKKKIVWQDVQSELKDGEAAIEIIRFNYYDKGWTDTVYYAALIVTKSTKEHPELVLLKNGNELDFKYIEGYKKVIELQREGLLSKEESDKIMGELYNQFWKPIEKKLQGIKKAFLSLDGVYNLINLETLINPATNKYLIDEIDLQLITSTRDLVISTQGKTRKDNVADLFGRPNYKLNEENRQKLAINLKNSEKQFFSDNTLRDLTRLKISDLPGTEIEVKNISKVMKDKGWEAKVFVGDSALEEVVKNIENPKVLHIATHGYFLSDVELEKKSVIGQLTTKTFGIESSKAYENPLLRSGLLFAGAERELDTNYTETSHTDNGILTAYEAMNLILDNTELVVLSACETGLGKIKNGEGVYGLQRAFIVAGAKAIIMSLWKVSDQATQELMTSFYTKWLEGKSKRQAFREAQLELMKLHPEPYYWGAFVMVGE
ncbi:MAG: tetratricopeptide repeat protein [Bacteroidetes bacterium]|nr:MAG: tetratricopeptide repeat protein [Bacteroidota bacterium]